MAYDSDSLVVQQTFEVLNAVGYKECMILADGEWHEVGLSPAGMDY